MNSIRAGLACHLASLGPVGFLPVAPGSWGSLAAIAIWQVLLGSSSIYLHIGVIAVASGAGVWVCGKGEERWGRDARPIVWDEMVGQWVTLLGAGRGGIAALAAAFFIFRLFDVVKPFPAYQVQRLRGGWGVMADDLIAGAYSAILLFVLRLTILKDILA